MIEICLNPDDEMLGDQFFDGDDTEYRDSRTMALKTGEYLSQLYYVCCYSGLGAVNLLTNELMQMSSFVRAIASLHTYTVLLTMYCILCSGEASKRIKTKEHN